MKLNLILIFILSFILFLRAGEPLDGQIIVDPNNPSWLIYKNGGPFFMSGPGDPEGFLYLGARNLDGSRNGPQMALIDKLKKTGANSIYLIAVRSHGGDGDETQNPFINSDPTQGLNEVILNQWEEWFTAMDDAGIVIFFIFYDDGSRIWDTGNNVGAEEQSFIEALVNRFEHHKHLIWCVAEEYAEKYSPERISKIAEIIKKSDDHNHVVAVHKNHGLDFSEFADDPNIDQFAIQYNVKTAEELHDGMVSAWQAARGRYNLNMSESFEHGSGDSMRRKNWAIAMGGAYVMVLFMDIANTSEADLLSNGYLRKFFEKTDFNRMMPRDDLAQAATRYVLANPGESYILYSTQPGQLGIQELSAGEYNLLWIDPITGLEIQESKVPVDSGTQYFSRPAGFGNEVALYLSLIEPGGGNVKFPEVPSSIKIIK